MVNIQIYSKILPEELSKIDINWRNYLIESYLRSLHQYIKIEFSIFHLKFPKFLYVFTKAAVFLSFLGFFSFAWIFYAKKKNWSSSNLNVISKFFNSKSKLYANNIYYTLTSYILHTSIGFSTSITVLCLIYSSPLPSSSSKDASCWTRVAFASSHFVKSNIFCCHSSSIFAAMFLLYWSLFSLIFRLPKAWGSSDVSLYDVVQPPSHEINSRTLNSQWPAGYKNNYVNIICNYGKQEPWLSW